VPQDLDNYLKVLRKNVAFKVGFFPLFYGVGIQVIIIANCIDLENINTINLVSKVDNQWSIVQSVFMLDTTRKLFNATRTWGQIVTGKYQNKIGEVIESEYANTHA